MYLKMNVKSVLELYKWISLVGWSLTELSTQAGYIVSWMYEMYIVYGREEKHIAT